MGIGSKRAGLVPRTIALSGPVALSGTWCLSGGREMRLTVRCDKCGTCLEGTAEALGELLACPRCGEPLQIDTSSAREESSPFSVWRSPVVWLGLFATAAAIAVIVWFAAPMLTRAPGIALQSDSGHPQADVDAGSRVGSAKARQAPPTGAMRSMAQLEGADTAPVSKKGANPQETAPVWVNVRYADLVDMDELTSSGDALKEVLRSPDLEARRRGEVQPYLDRFAQLLPAALEMRQGPDRSPQRNVVDQFAVGSAQPCWVAIFRSGRFIVTSDGRGRARAFLPGDDAREAYNAHYPVIRHALAGLVRAGVVELALEVFAYRNNYASCELRLNPVPYAVKAPTFPPPSDKLPVDVRGLQVFFEKGGSLWAARWIKRGAFPCSRVPAKNRPWLGSPFRSRTLPWRTERSSMPEITRLL